MSEAGGPAGTVDSIVPPDVVAAAAIDGTAAPGADPASPGPAIQASAPIGQAIDYNTEADELVTLAWAMFEPLYPSLGPIYTAERRTRIARALAPLMQKYGVTTGGVGPELTFAITIGPLIVPTVRAIVADNAAARSKAAADRAAAATDGRTGEASADRSNEKSIDKGGQSNVFSFEKAMRLPEQAPPGDGSAGPS